MSDCGEDIVDDVQEDADELKEDDVVHNSDSDASSDDDEEDEDELKEDELKEDELKEDELVVPDQPQQDHASRRIVPAAERTTFPRLTKYELAKIAGHRAMQIEHGSTLLIDAPKGVTDPLQLALAEIRAFKSPMIVERSFGDGSVEQWRVSEMLVVD